MVTIAREDVDWVGKIVGRLGMFLTVVGVSIYLTPDTLTFQGSEISLGVAKGLAVKVAIVGSVALVLGIIVVLAPLGEPSKKLP